MLTSHLKLLFHALWTVMKVVTEAMLWVLSHSWLKPQLLMKPVQCTEPEVTTTVSHAHQSLCAETAVHTSHVSSLTNIMNIKSPHMVKSRGKKLWSKKSMLMDPLLVVLLYLMNSNTTLVVFMRIRPETKILFTIFQLSASVLKTELSTGPSETHGENTGEKTVSSELSEVLTTSPLNQTAPGLSPKTPGLSNKSTPLPKLKETTQQTTTPMVHTQEPQKSSYLSSMVDVWEPPKLDYQMTAKESPLKLWLGKKSQQTISLLTLTGETLMERTTSHGLLTNTFLNIADHAGLMEQLQLLLIDSTSWPTTWTHPQLPYLHKSLSTARLVVIAMVVTQLVFMNMPTTLVFPINHAWSIKPKTWKVPALLSMSAEIVRAPLQMLEMMVSITAGLLKNIRNITSRTTMNLVVLTRWKLNSSKTVPFLAELMLLKD